MKLPSTIDTLKRLEKELAVYYAAIGVLVDECYVPGAGARMLGLQDVQAGESMASKIDVRSTRIGRMLPIWVRYAYEGVLSAGYSEAHVNPHDDDALERMRDMLYLLRTDDPFFELCLAPAQGFPEEIPLGGLREMVDLVIARANLDQGAAMSAGELALLAKMSERSVRNAMGPGGELKTDAQGHVDNAEALRWLKGRRGFVATQKLSLPDDLTAVPDDLAAVELPPFFAARLEAIWTAPGDEADNSTSIPGVEPWVLRASSECGLPIGRLLALGRLPLSVKPEECEALAKALKVDRVWLTYQVMNALYPEQCDMLLNPEAWREEAVVTLENSGPALEGVTVTLTDKMLAHGYIDMPASAERLFPTDCFGTRETGDEGTKVELLFGGQQVMTDIRRKSAKTISPRKRFGAWLNNVVGARPGDRIRVEKTGDRQFTLTHIAQ